MDGVSGHADRRIMLRWLEGLKDHPPRVFVNHGEDGVCDAFAQTIGETLGYPASAPYNGSVYDLQTGTMLEQGNTRRLENRGRQKKAESVFERLLSAGKRLMAIIEKSRGRSNKELAQMAEQINRLADKYEE
jgi:metallo-beta-lactamase family protein